MFETDHMRQFMQITDTLFSMQRRDICEEKTKLTACFKSAVFPVVRLRVAFQPRNVFQEFPIELSANCIKEITGIVEYPGSEENDPLTLAFKNFYLTDDKQTVIAESVEAVPSVIRTKTDANSEITDGKTQKAFIQGWPEELDDDFPLPATTPDRLVSVTIQWRSVQERLDFKRCLSSFYYAPCVPDNYNQKIRVERDGMAVRVRESTFPSRCCVCAYFLPTLHNEIKIKIVRSKRGYLEIGWASEKEQMRAPISINLLTKETTPGLQYIVFDQTQDTKLQKDDMVIIKRIHFKQNGKVLSDGIGIARARRASDPKGMPYMFIGAFELGETNFEGLVFWLRDPGDCIMMVE
ncbi:Hypothetical_protein [Hexamita inflata]|uniref:Hypothetical_protein n=1 Tax=Hexamita inflata TaxID=28002 RepID=A0AA86PFG9_9EUKA|nr:Hypothetical protein HINF_LOCUS13446 [Hexamita inflata]CAI9925812.1 Hypothetical protein HINF_LOCUS13457 [Hexamita inflata]CAI9937477.1 Hypothetical protein HINF_LOCUS25122 [Hexamita inflata]CAI9945905.1 Hypothetical protein HINF_LOCUS33550 [Hexamita inflata]